MLGNLCTYWALGSRPGRACCCDCLLGTCICCLDLNGDVENLFVHAGLCLVSFRGTESSGVSGAVHVIIVGGARRTTAFWLHDCFNCGYRQSNSWKRPSAAVVAKTKPPSFYPGMSQG